MTCCHGISLLEAKCTETSGETKNCHGSSRICQGAYSVFLFQLLSRFSLTVGFACRFLLPVESHLAAEMDMLQLKKKKSTPQVNCYLENSQCVNDICSNLIHMGNPVIRGGFSRCKSAQKICSKSAPSAFTLTGEIKEDIL